MNCTLLKTACLIALVWQPSLASDDSAHNQAEGNTTLSSSTEGGSTYFGPALELGVFKSQPCAITFHKPVEGSLECGMVAVPDRHVKPQRGVYQLPVVVLRRDSGSKTKPPLVFLHGGPGGRLFESADGKASPVSLAANMLVSLSSMAPNSDIVMFDQRAVHGSIFATSCSLGGRKVAGVSRSDHEAYRKRLVECLEQWRKQPNRFLDSFNRHEYAGDVELVRKALGIERWSLYGSSYGTRVALELLATVPSSIESVVLDSPLTGDRSIAATNLDAYLLALNHVFTLCENDKQCSSAWPEFRSSFVRAIEELEKHPVKLSYTHQSFLRFPKKFLVSSLTPAGEMDYDALFFLSHVSGLLYSGSGTSSLPRLLDAVVNRDHSFIRRSAGAKDDQAVLPDYLTRDPAERFLSIDQIVSAPVNLAYRCNEYRAAIADESRETGSASSKTLREHFLRLLPQYDDLLPVCDAVDLVPIASAETTPIETDVPVLLLAGRLDPLISVEDADKVTHVVPHARRFIVETAGHVPGMSSNCGRTMVTVFLDKSIKQGQPSCTEDRPIRFAMDTTSQWQTFRYVNTEYALSFPLGWTELESGHIHTRYISNDITLMQRIARGEPKQILDFVSTPHPAERSTQYAPEITDVRKVNEAVWTLYRLERESGIVNRFGIGEFGERSVLVLLTLTPGVDAAEEVETILHSAIDLVRVD